MPFLGIFNDFLLRFDDYETHKKHFDPGIRIRRICTGSRDLLPVKKVFAPHRCEKILVPLFLNLKTYWPPISDYPENNNEIMILDFNPLSFFIFSADFALEKLGFL